MDMQIVRIKLEKSCVQEWYGGVLCGNNTNGAAVYFEEVRESLAHKDLIR